jgi:hypothetical protein
MHIFFIKFAVTVFMVVGLSEVARRANPRIAGILVGLPLGAGLSAYFFTIERGQEFTLAAVPWGIAGLSASIVFSLAYMMTGRALRLPGRVPPIVASSIAAIAAYFATGRLLMMLELTTFRSAAITILLMVANIAFVRGLDLPRNKGASKPMGPAVIVFRAVVGGLTVATVTSLAGVVGAGWSGIMSAFPAMLFPILLVLHFEEGDRLYPGVIEGFGYGIGNLVIFYALLSFLLPRLGLNLSFVILYAVSALVLWAIARLRSLSQPARDTVSPR